MPASSTKPITGHTLGAAGALELAVCFCALKNQLLPPHVWDGEADKSFPRLAFVADARPKTALRRCMSNSFAFGGCNVSVIIEKE